MFDIVQFGAYLARLRKTADMTQSELADRLNVTRQAISKYERGDSFPDVTVLVPLAEIFRYRWTISSAQARRSAASSTF